jgi:hypothetical protein
MKLVATTLAENAAGEGVGHLFRGAEGISWSRQFTETRAV